VLTGILFQRAPILLCWFCWITVEVGRDVVQAGRDILVVKDGKDLTLVTTGEDLRVVKEGKDFVATDG